MPIHSAGTKRTSLSTPGGLCWALPDSCSLKHSTSSAPSAAQRLSGGRYVQHLNPLYHRYGRHFVVYRCLSLNMTSSYGVWRKSFLWFPLEITDGIQYWSFQSLSLTSDWSPSVGRRHIEVLRRHYPTQPCSRCHCWGCLGRRSRILQVHQQVAFGIGMFSKSFNWPSFCNFLGFIACFSILSTDLNVVCRHQSTLFLIRLEVGFSPSENVQMRSVLVFATVLQPQLPFLYAYNDLTCGKFSHIIACISIMCVRDLLGYRVWWTWFK